MQDILFSQKQYQALIKRLDDINDDVTAIKLKLVSDENFIDSHDLLKMFHISPRTLTRLLKSGSLPHSRIGRKYYYKVDAILECFKVNSNTLIEGGHAPP